ncbi:hypothetical protein [Pseudomonas sp. LRF_L74]|uniref:hypothetical protein n=1 Tax=Pseudomonas sp. LRF_L74 TaxID=3369422 RepID=UPI003F5F6FC5
MDNVPAAFILCCQLASLTGVSSIRDLPGCWEHQVEDWNLSFNGHDNAVANSNGDPVPALSVWVSHRTLIVCGCISPFDGMIIGSSENDLITALEKAITELGGVPATLEQQEPSA